MLAFAQFGHNSVSGARTLKTLQRTFKALVFTDDYLCHTFVTSLLHHINYNVPCDCTAYHMRMQVFIVLYRPADKIEQIGQRIQFGRYQNRQQKGDKNYDDGNDYYSDPSFLVAGLFFLLFWFIDYVGFVCHNAPP